MERKETLKRINKDGTEKKYSVLSTFDYTNRKFVIYTDYSMNEDKNINIYSGIYEDDGKVSPIMNEEDEIIVSNFIKYLEKGLNEDTLFD